MEPVIITAAVVGGELSKKDTPYLPITPDEIVAEALAARRAGASIIHLHARDVDGTPRHERKIFAAISQGILNACSKEKLSPPILQFSTGGSVGMSVAERIAPLQESPEMATLTLGSVNFGNDVFENALPTIETIAKELTQRKIAVELEIFDAGMLDTAQRLLKQKIIREPLHFNFVLGVPGGLGGETENLLWLLTKLPPGATWGVAGIGRFQLPLTTEALRIGGHVRVGLEDNIYYEKGELAKGNAPFVERLCKLAQEFGRSVASPEEARYLLKIKKA